MATMSQLRDQALRHVAAGSALAKQYEDAGREPTAAETAEIQVHVNRGKSIIDDIKAAKADAAVRTQLSALGGDIGDGGSAGPLSSSYGGLSSGYRTSSASAWAQRVAGQLGKAGRSGGVKDISSGQLGIPSVVEPVVQINTRPERLLDLVPTKSLTSNVFQYAKQIAAINNAAPVADHAMKPQSTYTFVDVEDRAHVIAHITAPIALRILNDHDDLMRVLEDQMRRHILVEVEDQMVAGDGAGENFRGLLHTSGTLSTAYATSIPGTLSAARLQLETANEVPTAWLMSPSDVATLDLLMDGQNRYYGRDILSSLMGSLAVVSSTAIPAGTAILGDWSQSRLYIREEAELAVDTAAELFKRNEAVLRYEGRYGFAVLKPGAFSVVDLTP